VLLTQSAWYEYFSLWAENPKSRFAFYPDMTEPALQLDRLPDDLPKYMVTSGAGDLRALYVLIDEAVPARAWLQSEAPAAEIGVTPHAQQQMQDLSR
jgi:hypothetical protein